MVQLKLLDCSFGYYKKNTNEMIKIISLCFQKSCQMIFKLIVIVLILKGIKKGLQRSIRNAPLASEWARWCTCDGQLDRPM